MRGFVLVALVAQLVRGARVNIEQHNNADSDADWWWWRSQNTPVQSAWDNHFAAFGGQDVDRILQDYTEKSVITVYDQTSGAQTVFTGLAGVRECFTGLFARLSDTSDLAAPVQEVHEAANGQPGSVLLIWKCPASGYAEATDTFIFDSDGKIIRQNVVVTDTQSNGGSYPLASEAPSGSGAVHDGWTNHFAAFGGQNVEQILADYTEESVITVYNQVSGEKSVFEGLSGVRTCFEGLFESLHDTSDLGAPIQHVEEGDSAQVFLIWRAPASGYATGTDSFIFNAQGKILRQNVVVHYEAATPVKDSWDNHFTAFGGQDVERILLDYTENSVITVYDQTSGGKTVFTGLTGVHDCFTGLFARLSDTSDLAAPVIEVHEAANGQPGSVLLVWRCPASGYAEATDTFIFDSDGKILRQNVVVTDTQSNGDSYPAASEAPSSSGAVHDGWNNHFAAFGGQNVEQILADYTDESVITVYNQVSGEKSVFEGLSGVRTCFEGLFASLHDTSDLGAPIQHVEEGDSAHVFLIWRAPASGYATGTDSFIFNAQGKILRQNVVVHYDTSSSALLALEAHVNAPVSWSLGSGLGGWWAARRTPVQSAWDNHFAAFGGQDIDRILLDYTEHSMIIVYDQTSGRQRAYFGLDGVRDCFTGLFSRLSDLSDLAAPVIDVKEATAWQPGSVFLLWKCPASGYAEATDTFIFDSDSKIIRQNVVITDTQENSGSYPVSSEAPSGSGAVHDAWNHHFAAFGGQNLEEVVTDYTEESVITVYNQVTGEKSVFEGLSGVLTCFEGLFESLHDTSDLGAPIVHVEEGAYAQVFLIWRAPASGYTTGTDSFIFNAQGKILRQHVVVHYEAPTPVKDSWDNHFAAFGGQDIERVLLDYTDNSEIIVYDQTSGDKTVFTGLAGVRQCFTGLFARLFDTSDLAAPVIEVHEAANGQPGSVFLVWRCPASGYAEATDTFIFDSNSKILRQNVVVTDTQSNGDSYPLASEAPSGSGAVHDGWNNHFAAFGGQNVEQILADYTDESVITVYNQVSGEKSVFAGMSGVRTCFEGLFASLHDTSDLGAPIQHVEEGDSAQVFLIWRAPASGYATGTDSFIFNAQGKILRQNVVVHYETSASLLALEAQVKAIRQVFSS